MDKFEMGEELKRRKWPAFWIYFPKLSGQTQQPFEKTLVVKSDKKKFYCQRETSRLRKIISADSLNIYDLLAYKYLIIPKDAIPVL